MKNQDQKTKKTMNKRLEEELQAEFAEAFEVNLLEVDQYFKEQIQELDFDLEDPLGDSF